MIPWNTINGLDLLWLTIAGVFAYLWWRDRKSVLRERVDELTCDLHLALLQRDKETAKLQHERDTVAALMSILRSQRNGLYALQDFLRRMEKDGESLNARIKRGVI